MRTCFSMDPLTLDPRKNGEQITSTFLYMLYDGLTRLKANGDVELALAESVEISEDGKTYLFFLKKACWSDGSPITAYDFEYTWKKTLDPSFNSLSPQILYPIRNAELAAKGKISLDKVGIQALEERLLKVELEYPIPYFLSLLSFCNCFPISKKQEIRNPSWDTAPCHEALCSGPFRIVKWNKKREILCEKNPLYWNADQVALDKIHISIINDPYVTLQLFDQDALDLVSVYLCSLPLQALEPYRHDKTLHYAPSGGTTFCSFNLRQYPFNNPNIRKAFSYAIDRRFITENITLLNEIPATRLLPPSLTKHPLSQFSIEQDEELARGYLHRGLKEIGVLGTETDHPFSLRLFINNLTLSFEANPLNRKVAESLQEQWKKVLGFKVKLESFDYSTQVEKLNRKNYGIALASWISQINDPINIFERFKNQHLPKNFPGYESARFNEWIDLSYTEKDPLLRAKVLNQAELVMLQEMPLTPIYHSSHNFLCKPHLTNLQVTATGCFYLNECKTTLTHTASEPIAAS